MNILSLLKEGLKIKEELKRTLKNSFFLKKKRIIEALNLNIKLRYLKFVWADSFIAPWKNFVSSAECSGQFSCKERLCISAFGAGDGSSNLPGAI